MGLGSCLTCVKYLLFIFNFLFWLIGCALVALGVWLRVDPESLGDIKVFNELTIGSYILIAIGSVIWIVGFFGCCGAIKENQCLLATFFICLFLIFSALLGIGIYYIVNPEGTAKRIEKSYTDVAAKYDPKNELVSGTVNTIHTQFKCCGYKLGVGDFLPNLPEGCTLESTLKPKCPQAISEAIQKGSIVIAGIALGTGIVLILGMIFSMMLCCAIRDSTA